MYNELEYDLEELGLPNIVYAHKKSEVRTTRKLVVHPFLEPLAVKLAKARPKWVLYGTSWSPDGTDTAHVRRFDVYEGGVELGYVRKGYNYSSNHDTFDIDNTRMSQKRQRGSVTSTKDLSKAFKIITREFHGKTTEEILREAKDASYNQVQAIERERRNHYQHRVYAINDAAFEFAVANWEAFVPFAHASNVNPKMLDTFHEAKAAKEESDALMRAYQQNNTKAGMLVVLRGDDYIIQHGGETTILTQEQLTSYMKRCIGLLKLADKGTFIPGVGVKTTPDAMFIMPEHKGDEASE